MKKITKLILPAIFVASLASGQALVDYQFNETSGFDVNDPAEVINAGSENDAAWNFGVGRVQNGNLNYGYTSSFKFATVDTNAGTTAFRTLAFSDDLTTADMTAYSLTIDFAGWDLRRDWDDNASASDKGIQIALVGDGGSATVAFTTYGTAGFRALSDGEIHLLQRRLVIVLTTTSIAIQRPVVCCRSMVISAQDFGRPKRRTGRGELGRHLVMELE